MRDRRMQFGSYDPLADVTIKARNLPHWFQAGATTFVTFRASDSLPKDVILRWQRKPRLGCGLVVSRFNLRIRRFNERRLNTMICSVT